MTRWKIALDVPWMDGPHHPHTEFTMEGWISKRETADEYAQHLNERFGDIHARVVEAGVY